MSVDPQGPKVGADEWVARQAHRREYLPSWLGDAQRGAERIGWWPRLAIAGLAGLALPLLGLGGFQLQVGIDALVIALLAVGLNVVVGWSGLLDLGYVAFFAIGAYTTAYFTGSLPVTPGFKLNPFVILPIAVIVCLAAGLLLGAPTLRLRGDYLAIVTLGFHEIVQLFLV